MPFLEKLFAIKYMQINVPGKADHENQSSILLRKLQTQSERAEKTNCFKE